MTDAPAGGLPYHDGIKPKEIEMEQLNAIVLQNGQGRALWHFGALMNFKALTEETGGQYWAVEGLADKNMAVPLHAHTREDEVWFVIEGEIVFVLGDETIVGSEELLFTSRAIRRIRFM